MFLEKRHTSRVDKDLFVVLNVISALDGARILG